MKALTIIKAGSTFPTISRSLGDFEDWVTHACGLSDQAVSVINVADGEALPSVERLSGVIITGSHAMVTDQVTWIQALASWIPQVLEDNVPLLGICFGHQLLAQAMGGRSDYNPKGREIGTVAITLTPEGKQDRLLGSLPEVFNAHTTHAQTVIKLPDNALRLAENLFEANHAFRLGDSAWGLQFHPEFSEAVMRAYVSEQTVSLLGEGHDVEALQATICNTDAANALLKRFFTIVQESMI
jgi:GMP synthase (glutamine-hydrolysing)